MICPNAPACPRWNDGKGSCPPSVWIDEYGRAHRMKHSAASCRKCNCALDGDCECAVCDCEACRARDAKLRELLAGWVPPWRAAAQPPA